MNRLALIVGFSALALGACKEKEPDTVPQPRAGTLNFEVVHEFDGEVVEPESGLYLTANGDSIEFGLIKHYLSNFEVHSVRTGWHKADNYILVDNQVEGTENFSLAELPFAEYDSIRFYMGIDSATNHDHELFGKIDPDYSMLWTWNTGYIFLKYEGKLVNDPSTPLGFAYHIGGDNFLMTYQMPLASSKVLSESKVNADVKLKFNLAELFHNPNTIDMDQAPLVSHTMDEPVFTMQLRDNLLNAWSAE